MSITQFIRILWARRMIIIISTLACLAAGVLAALFLPRSYNATSRVLLDVSRADPLDANGITNAFAKSYVPSEAEFIMSYRVGARVAQNLGLTNDPSLRAQYDEFVSEQVDKSNVPSIAYWIGGNISQNVTAAQYLATNVIDITYKGDSAQGAAAMSNAVRQAYADETLSERRDQATQGVAWLDRQMGEVGKQREAAQQRLVDYQKANGIVLLNGGTDTASNQLQALTQSAPLSMTQMANPNAAQIAALDAKIKSESADLGPNHPVIQDLKAQRNALANAPTGVSSVAGPSHSTLIETQGAKVLAQQDKIGEAKRLQADVDALTAQYTTMAAHEAALRQQMNGDQFSIVMLDAATPPLHTAAPQPPLIVVGAFGFGLFAGMLIALIVEFSRRRVRGVDDLLASTDVPVIGVIDAPPVALA